MAADTVTTERRPNGARSTTGKGKRNASPPSPEEAERDARQEFEQRRSELERRRIEAKHRRTEEKVLQVELSGKLTDHAKAKIVALHSGDLQGETDYWLASLAGISGDPISPPLSVALHFLMDTQGAKFRGWADARIDAIAADPTSEVFTPRSREEILSDIEEAKQATAAADSEEAKAKRLATDAGTTLASLNGGKRR